MTFSARRLPWIKRKREQYGLLKTHPWSSEAAPQVSLWLWTTVGLPAPLQTFQQNHKVDKILGDFQGSLIYAVYWIHTHNLDDSHSLLLYASPSSVLIYLLPHQFHKRRRWFFICPICNRSKTAERIHDLAQPAYGLCDIHVHPCSHTQACGLQCQRLPHPTYSPLLTLEFTVTQQPLFVRRTTATPGCCNVLLTNEFLSFGRKNPSQLEPQKAL